MQSTMTFSQRKIVNDDIFSEKDHIRLSFLRAKQQRLSFPEKSHHRSSFHREKLSVMVFQRIVSAENSQT